MKRPLGPKDEPTGLEQAVKGRGHCRVWVMGPCPTALNGSDRV